MKLASILPALIVASTAASASSSTSKYGIPPMRDGVGLVKTVTRGGTWSERLSPELRELISQITGPKSRNYFTPAQLKARFGIDAADSNAHILVAIHLTPGSELPDVGNLDVSVFRKTTHTWYARADILSLKGLASGASVQSIDFIKAASFPRPGEQGRRRIGPMMPTRGGETSIDFDHAGLTGKGVVVGIVDSGIDWRHADFRNADGSTRIVALWDLTDNSWSTSKGKIGSESPLKDKSGAPLGTLYTREQIDAALKGTGTINSVDSFGHGTACAGTAAGNGLGTGNGEPASTYAGVAPEADLIVVKAGDGGSVSPVAPLGTAFIVDTANKLGEPCVISHSFGNHDSGHDGTDPEEQFLDGLAGAGKPGVILCAAAGNEGRETLHARLRFGPEAEGQADAIGEPAELYVHSKTEIDAYFDHADDWGLAIEGLDNYLIGKDGKPDIFYVGVNGANVHGYMDRPQKSPADFGAFFNAVQVNPSPGGKEDVLSVPLPPGQYLIFALGTGKTVDSGVADLYLPFPDDASFGEGADKEYTVSTPGDAANVITVGAYYFRHSWKNLSGQTTSYNNPDGDLCSYSNAGYSRDGTVKPEIVAPASFMISTLASGSEMGEISKGTPDKADIMPDGVHLAWAGTSAASPYVAGVIALMLQKNPTLDEDQVRHILETTARSDSFTGAVPNSGWGYGKIDPAAAIAAVHPPAAAASSTTSAASGTGQ